MTVQEIIDSFNCRPDKARVKMLDRLPPRLERLTADVNICLCCNKLMMASSREKCRFCGSEDVISPYFC